MLDRYLLATSRRPMLAIAQRLAASDIQADHISFTGFAIGMLALPLIIAGLPHWALLAILLNRVTDGLDGCVARIHGASDRGAFLDITLDFLFYASVPLAFAIADPAANALPAAVLIYSFVGTGTSFLAFAIIAAKRQLDSTAYPEKGFYYLGGLTEASETIAVFALMCLLPQHFAVLAYGFAALCALTLLTRIVAGWQLFAQASPTERKRP